MEIPLDQLLWRTKGKNWEYCFLSKPRNVPSESWWLFFQDLTKEVTTFEPVDFVTGEFQIKSRIHVFAATRFVDKENTDEFGRDTEQVVVWFPDNPNHLEVLPKDWGLQVTRQLNQAVLSHEKLDTLSDSDDQSPEVIFQEIIKLHPVRLLIEGEPSSGRGFVTLKKKSPLKPKQILRDLRFRISATVVSAILLFLLFSQTCVKTKDTSKKSNLDSPPSLNSSE